MFLDFLYSFCISSSDQLIIPKLFLSIAIANVLFFSLSCVLKINLNLLTYSSFNFFLSFLFSFDSPKQLYAFIDSSYLMSFSLAFPL